MSDEPKKPTSPEDPKAEAEAHEKAPAEAETAEAAPPEREEEAEEKEAEAEDAFRPEAIAKRMDTIGGEDEIERVAREEEQKLAQRKKELKKKGGKKGLESAASKRLAKIGEKAVRRPVSAVPSEVDAFRLGTNRFGGWVRANRKVFGAVVGLAIAGGAAFGFYTSAQHKKLDEASALLAAGVAAQEAHINPTPTKDDELRRVDLLPSFKNEAERREAALAKYRDVTKKFPGSGPAVFARLYEADLLLQAGKPDEAATAFQEVRATALAKADPEVMGRATEGLGFAYEMQADVDPSTKDKSLNDARDAFKQLETVSLKGMKELAKYHLARVSQKLGDLETAKSLLGEVMTLTKPADPTKPEDNAFPYLGEAAADRLRLLGNRDILPRKERQEKAQQAAMQKQQQEELQKRIQELQKQHPPTPAPSGSTAPAPAPSSSAGETP